MSRKRGRVRELVRVGSDEAREMMKRVATWSFETLFFFPCCQISPISQSGLCSGCCQTPTPCSCASGHSLSFKSGFSTLVSASPPEPPAHVSYEWLCVCVRVFGEERLKERHSLQINPHLASVVPACPSFWCENPPRSSGKIHRTLLSSNI